MNQGEEKLISLTGFDLSEFENFRSTSYKFIFFDLVLKLWRNILRPENAKNLNIFRTTGEVEYFHEEKDKEFNLKVNRGEQKRISNMWKIMYEKYLDHANEYEISHLAYSFLKKKAYGTLLKLKIHSERINFDFQEIVEYFVRINKQKIRSKTNAKNINFFIQIIKKNKKTRVKDDLQTAESKLSFINNYMSKKTNSSFKKSSSTSLVDFSKQKSHNHVRFSSTNLIVIPEAKEKPNKMRSGKSLIFKEHVEGNVNTNFTSNKRASKKSVAEICNSKNLKSVNLNENCGSDFDTINNNKDNPNVNNKISFKRDKKENSGLRIKTGSLESNLLSLFKIDEKNQQKEKIDHEMNFFRKIINSIKLTKSVEDLKENIKSLQEEQKAKKEIAKKTSLIQSKPTVKSTTFSTFNSKDFTSLNNINNNNLSISVHSNINEKVIFKNFENNNTQKVKRYESPEELNTSNNKVRKGSSVLSNKRKYSEKVNFNSNKDKTRALAREDKNSKTTSSIHIRSNSNNIQNKTKENYSSLYCIKFSPVARGKNENEINIINKQYASFNHALKFEKNKNLSDFSNDQYFSCYLPKPKKGYLNVKNNQNLTNYPNLRVNQKKISFDEFAQINKKYLSSIISPKDSNKPFIPSFKEESNNKFFEQVKNDFYENVVSNNEFDYYSKLKECSSSRNSDGNQRNPMFFSSDDINNNLNQMLNKDKDLMLIDPRADFDYFSNENKYNNFRKDSVTCFSSNKENLKEIKYPARPNSNQRSDFKSDISRNVSINKSICPSIDVIVSPLKRKK